VSDRRNPIPADDHDENTDTANTDRATDRTVRHTRNVASGNDRVESQIGFQFGPMRRKR